METPPSVTTAQQEMSILSGSMDEEQAVQLQNELVFNQKSTLFFIPGEPSVELRFCDELSRMIPRTPFPSIGRSGSLSFGREFG